MRFFTAVTLLLATAVTSALSADTAEPGSALAAVAERDVVADVVAPFVVDVAVEARSPINNDDEPLLEREFTDALGGHTVKRACNYNVNCKCDSRGKQLTVCGNCRWNSGSNPYVVTKNRKNNHIYECSKDGKKCCSYGVGSDCGTSSARCIIN